MITVRIIGELDLVGGAELLSGLSRVAAEARQPPQEGVSVANQLPIADPPGTGEGLGGGIPGRADLPETPGIRPGSATR